MKRILLAATALVFTVAMNAQNQTQTTTPAQTTPDDVMKLNQEKHADHIDVIFGICDPQLRLGEYCWLALIASMALSILGYGCNGSLIR